MRSSKSNGEAGKAAVYVVMFLAVVGLLVLVSNFVGPKKGWLFPVGSKKVVVSPHPSQPAPQKTTPVTAPPPPPPKETKPSKPVSKPVVEKKAKPSVKEIYDKIFAKYRKRFKDPVVGKEYYVYMSTGTIHGKLKSFSDGKVVIKMPNVTMTCRIDKVKPRSYPTLFPKRAANIMALKELKKVLAKREEEEAKTKEAGPSSDGQGGGPSAEPGRGASSHSAKVVYDPSPAKTPESLKKALKSFAEWVNMQQRHIGGQLAEKAYAKRQGRAVVLYLKTSKLFRSQDYDVRYSVAEAMGQVWGFKCLDHGVIRSPGDAHIVLLDAHNRLVGGSKEYDASAIWVKK